MTRAAMMSELAPPCSLLRRTNPVVPFPIVNCHHVAGLPEQEKLTAC